jgi:hypothetical protein
VTKQGGINHRHDVCLGVQDAEAIFRVAVGDALDEARQRFLA